MKNRFSYSTPSGLVKWRAAFFYNHSTLSGWNTMKSHNETTAKRCNDYRFARLSSAPTLKGWHIECIQKSILKQDQATSHNCHSEPSQRR